MTDIEINIALAQAMGWVETTEAKWFFTQEVVGFLLRGDAVVCVTCSNELDDNDEEIYLEKSFDYRDPVIFVSICKHWKLVANFEGWVSGVFKTEVFGHWSKACIEKAAALTVIELAKRGIK